MPDFELPPRLPLARLPTPIERLDRLSEHLAGPSIYVKRDDLTECACSGNKIRKLEFLLADAREKGGDIVLTCGGIQSNHARATAVAARRLGLDSFLLLRGEEPAEADGNLLIDRLVDAEIEWITPDQYSRRTELFADRSRRFREAGRRPYVIVEGGSDAVGAWGYVLAAMEIREQERELGVRFDWIVSAAGSGGTLAGLLAGKALAELAGEILAFAVCDDTGYFQTRAGSILRELTDRFRLPLEIPPASDIHVTDEYKGIGYGLATQEELETLRMVAALEGILLDPAYTNKAMHGLIAEIRRGRFLRTGNILFIHTGGIFSLFPMKENLLRAPPR